jgi:hypothetical protein
MPSIIPYTAPPDQLRVRAVQRRASVSPSVARLVADLAFRPDPDRVLIMPALLLEVRS